ncbi:IS3 family transposase [Escherichia coli]|nr:IS3 family transposase [Escherichia coli]
MSSKACGYDNVGVESFFHSLKVEYPHVEQLVSREIMWAMLFDYIAGDSTVVCSDLKLGEYQRKWVGLNKDYQS